MKRLKYYFKLWRQQPKRAAIATFGIMPLCYVFAYWFYTLNRNALGILMLCAPVIIVLAIGIYTTKDIVELK